jgi:3-hydroxyacyl-CoA dehydrogenase
MTEIQKSAAKHPERCLIGHPINPVYLIPLVEIVPGEQTGQQFVHLAKEFYESIEKVPVALKKEVPGYLENRLTAALWREAIDLVINDVASVEDIDKTIYAGPGLRYALMGPHLIYHLGGGEGGVKYFIDHLQEAFTQWWTDMNCWTHFPEGTADKLSEGMGDCMHDKSIKEICAWRDKKLVELLKIVDINKTMQ